MLERPRGGERAIATLTDYATIGDSVSLAKIGDQLFTITRIEDSDYAQGDDITPGVKITTQETFDIDGHQTNKFHTTRVAIVKRLKNEKMRDDINNKNVPLGPVKCVAEKAANGKSFFNLVDA